MTSVGRVNRPVAAVVGGGIIGLSIAWRLTRADSGFSVDVLDQSLTGNEASWAGAGMLAPGGEIDAPSEVTELALESRRAYPKFIRGLETESQWPIDYQECGGLDVAYTEEELIALEQRAERQSALGIHSKHIAPAQVKTFWPRIRPEGLLGGRFYAEDAIVNPRELTHALKTICVQREVTLCEHCRANAIEVSDSGVALDTDGGVRHFEIAIIAAGAWSSQIAVSGVPELPKVEPIKGQLIGYMQPDQTCNTIIRHGRTYLLQRGNGLLIAGSSMERVGFDREINPFIEAEIAERAGFVLPHLTETSISKSWMGFRPAGGGLHMRMWHSPRLYLAYGHFRNGILLAPVTATRIAALVTANWRTL